MYKVTGRQILVIAFASALFAVVTVLGVQQLSNHFQPFGSAAAWICAVSVYCPGIVPPKYSVDMTRVVTVNDPCAGAVKSATPSCPPSMSELPIACQSPIKRGGGIRGAPEAIGLSKAALQIIG